MYCDRTVLKSTEAKEMNLVSTKLKRWGRRLLDISRLPPGRRVLPQFLSRPRPSSSIPPPTQPRALHPVSGAHLGRRYYSIPRRDAAAEKESKLPLSFSAPPVRKNRFFITRWLRLAKNDHQKPRRPAHRVTLSETSYAGPWAIHLISLHPATPFPTGGLPSIFTDE